MGEHRCAKRVPDAITGRFYPCARNATVEENGQRWCKQHAPSSVAARQAKSDAKWKADFEARARLMRRADDCIAACAGVDDPHPGELARLRAELARWKEKV